MLRFITIESFYSKKLCEVSPAIRKAVRARIAERMTESSADWLMSEWANCPFWAVMNCVTVADFKGCYWIV